MEAPQAFRPLESKIMPHSTYQVIDLYGLMQIAQNWRLNAGNSSHPGKSRV
jgi:biotin synthase-related radical SAM superfamily protein